MVGKQCAIYGAEGQTVCHIWDRRANNVPYMGQKGKQCAIYGTERSKRKDKINLMIKYIKILIKSLFFR